MSLINDALKRARVEAARRDAAEKGVPPSALPVYQARSRRPWLAPVAGFVAGLAAVGVAAGAFWFARRPMSPEGARSAPVVEDAGSAQAPAPINAAQAPSPAEDRRPVNDSRVAPPKEPVGARAGVARRHSSPSGGGASEPSGPGESAVAAGATAAPPAASAVPAPGAAAAVDLAPKAPERAPIEPAPAVATPQSRQPPPAPDTGGRTYFREAAPAGTLVKVDFIVWSKSRPFAQINGHLLSPGQAVDGYTVLEVERERVELEGGGARFWIRVK